MFRIDEMKVIKNKQTKNDEKKRKQRTKEKCCINFHLVKLLTVSTLTYTNLHLDQSASY